MTVRDYLYKRDNENDKISIIEYNKDLVEKYPFIKPISDDNYDYSYTMLDFMPNGWRIALSSQLLDEIKNELIRCNSLHNYYILDIKEKFGELRISSGPFSTECCVSNIIKKYESLSKDICIDCGKPYEWIHKHSCMRYCQECACRYYYGFNIEYSSKSRFWEDIFIRKE